MIANKKVLALIPARGNSKGIKKKNIIDLCGKPLIAYTIEVAKSCKYIDDVVVSTDNAEIADIARHFGAEIPFMRPDELASDTAKTISAVIHAIETLKSLGRQYDILILLQPTQPLRSIEDMEKSLEKFIAVGCKNLVSVSAVNDHPILIRSIGEDGRLLPLLNQSSSVRRQDMPPYYRVNGCIYINNIDTLTENTSLNDNEIPYIMEQSHSVDIDDLSQLEMAKYYLMKRGCSLQ